MSLRSWFGDKLVKAVAKCVPPRLMMKKSTSSCFRHGDITSRRSIFTKPIPDPGRLKPEAMGTPLGNGGG